MPTQLTHISTSYLEAFSELVTLDWLTVFHRLQGKQPFTAEDFEYYLLTASLFSSKIEGNPLDANSFMRFRGNKATPRKKEVQEIEDLATAYRFAAENALNRPNFLKAHALLSTTFLPSKDRGKTRRHAVSVNDSRTLRPVYVAVEPEYVAQELSALFTDVQTLLSRKLSHRQAFYYAGMLHAWVAMIHPFADGNGRAARLIEKWFLSQKIGPAAWSIPTERYYWEHRPDYYRNIALGLNYYVLKWERVVPLLLMPIEALAEAVGPA